MTCIESNIKILYSSVSSADFDGDVFGLEFKFSSIMEGDQVCINISVANDQILEQTEELVVSLGNETTQPMEFMVASMSITIPIMDSGNKQTNKQTNRQTDS